jgi:beta-mannosidase
MTLSRSTTASKQSFEFEIEQPSLWWPHGLGEQPLYQVSTKVDAGDVEQFSVTRNIGLRRVNLITEPDAQGEPFQLQINDVLVFCKGANWIPSDSFIPRRTKAKLYKTLTMARDAEMNMIRVWGGGVYESPDFHDICDELGLMVWQDFMFACATYPEHDDFIDNVRYEVRMAVRQLRDHPSVVVWCGNNENEQDWYKYLNRPYPEMTGHTIFHDVIPTVLSEEDTSRPYRQSSPFGGEDPNAEHIGTRHQWNIWSNWASPSSVIHDRSRFVAEFGFQAPACLKTWRDYISEDELWPQSRMVEHHNKQVEGTERLYRFLAEQFKVPSTFEDFVFKSQVVQAEALKTCIEHWRSQKFHTAGTIIWQLNDCWPVSSWSLIDSELRPKAAYWYAKRFFAPILLVIRRNRQSLDFLAVNDTLAEASCRLVISRFSLHKKQSDVFDQTVSIPINNSIPLTSCQLSELGIRNEAEEYVRAQLFQGDNVIADNRYFFLPYKHLRLSRPNLESELTESAEGEWRFGINSDRFVKAVQIEVPENEWELSHNVLDVDPGEPRRFDIRALKSGRELQPKDIAMRWIE